MPFVEAGSYEYLFLIVDMKNLQKDLEWSKKGIKST